MVSRANARDYPRLVTMLLAWGWEVMRHKRYGVDPRRLRREARKLGLEPDPRTVRAMQRLIDGVSI